MWNTAENLVISSQEKNQHNSFKKTHYRANKHFEK